MGKKSQPSPPPAPNPYEIANADAQYNRINQFTPFGNLQFSGPQRNNATLTLDPRVQQLADMQIGLDQGLLGLSGQALAGDNGIAGLIGNPMDLEGLPTPSLPTLEGIGDVSLPGVDLNTGQGIFNPNLQGLINTAGLPGLMDSAGNVRNRAEDAFFDRSSRLLNEQFGRQEEGLRQRLANQGLQEDAVPARQEMGLFNQRRGETFENLARDAVLFGGQEASRDIQNQLALRGQGFNEAATQAGFGNQAQLQQLAAGMDLAGFGNQAQLQNLAAGMDVGNFDIQNTLTNNAVAQQNLQNTNALRNQILGEQQALRGQQFNELASLLGLQQVQQPGLQNFFGPGMANVTDAFGLQQQALQNNFNTRSRSASAAKGATADLLGTLGGAALMRP